MKKRGAFFSVLVALSLAALAGLVALLAPGAAPDTPPVSLAEPPAVTPDAATGPEDGAEDRTLEVNAATVQTVVALLRRAESYSRVLTVQSYWTGGSSETEYEVHVRANQTRVTVRDGSAVERNILLRDGEIRIWYSDAEGVYRGPAEAGDADAWQSIPSYEDLLRLPPEAILEAGYTVYNGETAVYARYVAGPFGYETSCYVSDRNGLLIGSETYDGDVLIYAMRSSPVDISTPDDSVFELPDTEA